MSATSYGLRFAVNLSILFTEVPLLERPAAARAAGFDAVEAWWPFPVAEPSAGEVDAFVGALEAADVALIGLNFFAGDMPGGERGVVSWPGRVDDFRASVPVLVEIARRTGCRAFNALYGQRLPGVDPVTQDDTAAANLAFAADAVGAFGGTVLVEPLSQGENGAYPLLTSGDVLTVIDRVRDDHGAVNHSRGAAANLQLLLDTYHLTRNGDDPVAVLAAHADRVGHVQIADAPGRGQPGTGAIDFPAVFAALCDHGYAGHVACEYKPVGPSAGSFEWLREMG
ncbi:MAG TPA: TIM barrel protein [Streptosporangiaceae bacterium]